jgi:hypothetical protein
LERARIVPPEERIREPAVRAMLWLVLVFGLAYRERLVGLATRGRFEGSVRECRMDILFHLSEAAGADLYGYQLVLKKLVVI